VLQAGVGDASVPEVEPFEAGERGNVPHGIIVGLGFGQIELS